MSNELQLILTQVVLKTFYLLLLVLFFAHFNKKNKVLSQIPLLLAIIIFINILVSLPLPFQFDNTSLGYMSSHLLLMLVINILKIRVVTIMPIDNSNQKFEFLKKSSFLKFIFTILFLSIIAVLIVNSLGSLINENDLFYLLACIDMFTTIFVMIVYAIYFYLSFSFTLPFKSFNTFFLLLNVLNVFFYIVFFLKTLYILPIPDNVWFRIISFSFGIIFIVFHLIYLIGLLFYTKKSVESKIYSEESKSIEIVKIKGITIKLLEGDLALVLRVLDSNNSIENLTLVPSKLTKPLGYWFIFAIAKKYDLKLTHSDISIIKFRMIEYWNKSMSVKISQSLLFENARIQYEFQLDSNDILLNFENNFITKYSIFAEIFNEFYTDFFPVLAELNSKENQKIERKNITNNFLSLLKNLN